MKYVYWVIIYAFIYAVVACGLYQSMEWRETLRKEAPGIHINNIHDFWMSIPFLGFFIVARFYFEKYLGKYVERRLKLVDPVNFEVKKDRVVKEVYHAGWYSIMTSIGLALFWNSQMLPTYLFGARDWTTSNYDYPYGEQLYSVRIYFMIQLAFHSYGGIVNELNARVYGKKHADYNEITIHHLITFGMIVMAYLCMLYPLGIMILFCSDITDMFMFLSKSTRDVQLLPNSLFDVLALVTMASWFYIRGFVMPYCGAYLSSFGLYYMMALEDKKTLLVQNKALYMASEKGYANAALIKVTLLSLLSMLNYYWLILMAKIAYNRFIKKDKSFSIKSHGEKAIMQHSNPVDESKHSLDATNAK